MPSVVNDADGTADASPLQFLPNFGSLGTLTCQGGAFGRTGPRASAEMSPCIEITSPGIVSGDGGVGCQGGG